MPSTSPPAGVTADQKVDSETVPFAETDLNLPMAGLSLYDKDRLTFTLGGGNCTFCTCDPTTEYATQDADYTM